MNLDILKEELKKKNLYKDENVKNIVSKCFLCGDHPDSRKQSHLWISKNPEKPIYHCFFSGCVGSIRNLALQLTGNKMIADQILSREELTETLKRSSVNNIKHNEIQDIKIPELDVNKFPKKLEYIKKRTLIEDVKYDNLIFDVKEFIRINPHLNILKNEEARLVNGLHDNFICFLGHKKSVAFFRNTDPNSNFKFFKYSIQPSQYNLLEYIKFDGKSKEKKLVVLAEGVFNNLAVMNHNVLNLAEEAFLFVSGQTFAYEAMLKSICFDYNLYKVDVVILSDTDKPKYTYIKFLNNSRHVINKLRTYYNYNKKDFGEFPISPRLLN